MTADNQPLAAALSLIPLTAIMLYLLARRAGALETYEAVHLDAPAGVIMDPVVVVFLYAPLLLVVLNAFDWSKTFAFPPTASR